MSRECVFGNTGTDFSSLEVLHDAEVRATWLRKEGRREPWERGCIGLTVGGQKSLF